MEITSHRQLRKLVADQLRAAILDGKIKSGDWLRQERLAQELNVSQMPVREALKELAAEGLIEHVPYRGARVVTFSIEDISDLYEHRAFLEGRAAEFAATQLDSGEIEALREMAGKMAALPPEQIAEYRRTNRAFHETIFRASKHEYIIRTLSQMWEAFPTMLIANFAATAQTPLPQRDDQDRVEHQAIVAALEAKDSKKAGEAARAHILSAARHLIQSLKGGA
ncbi:MAG: GntR family transcriptional regulator [Chloroflexi bacterium]|nr:GntR family transcriptional regulator [Chloroflexi bacterium CFX1]MCK6566957.1 GntR family transcriptional regulator [Anaerolineales bacterium]MCQ3951941.1 GntR family transcriptional regulator [Chloroflexota bacterium]MDL1919643.1 GntR family transcriptional regulator [Chloroflexi bacterium CFX5]NUQ58725.1 GntR family transcriptional regulator [Anaerolineales bacterium]